MKQKILLYLYGTPNIVGSVLGLIGLVLFLLGVIKDFWILIVIGLYAIGAVGTPRNPTIQLSMSQALDTKSIIEFLNKLVGSVEKKLSLPVYTKLSDLRDILVQIIPKLKEMEGTSHQLHAVQQTVTDYIPGLLESYLKLPPAYARMHTMKNGKTPRDELIGQLDLLQSEMSKILEGALRSDVDALLTHGRFLESRFSSGYDFLENE